MQVDAPRFKEWIAAEKAAAEAERLLHRTMLATVDGGPAPLAELVLDARAKRAKAHWLFDEAMREMRALADSLHHGRIDTRSSSLHDEGREQH